MNDEHVAVIVTQDRKSGLDFTVATMGRIKKSDIDTAIGQRIKKGKVMLCSDAHVSYKGFAIDNDLEQQGHAPGLCVQDDGEQCRHGKVSRHRNKVRNVNINAELN